MNRLDSLHEDITAYLGGKLSHEPLESDQPKRILELGYATASATKHRAMQAAITFPDAEILAVDLAEIPRTLPENVRFIKADLTNPWDFAEPESFDIVHARCFVLNLPNYQSTLRRAIAMLKPGGWLSLEDPDNTLYDDAGAELGSGLKTWFKEWKDILMKRNLNFEAVREYESFLTHLDEFSSVSVRKASIPISSQPDVPTLERLGITVRNALNVIFRQTATNLAGHGLTLEMAEKAIAEVNEGSRWGLRLDFYFLWTRKRM
ncbi:S-adenosyl-L-methionine-dependent methyltransferase [Ramaria rubella]|nr:S-adenosyl-L-methionine-dependent methyltransferase [Ramaria rubella]